MFDENEDLFTNRPPTPEQGAVLDAITETMVHAAEALVALLPSSRYRSTAMARLEECSMWAKKATVFTVGVEDGDQARPQEAGLRLSDTMSNPGDLPPTRVGGRLVSAPTRVGDPANAPTNVRPHRAGDADPK